MAPEPAVAPSGSPLWRRPIIQDVGICAVITLYAAWLTGGLWPHPATRALALNPNDQALVEWMLAHGTRLYSGDFHLVTPLLNAPDGVNLMCNASFILLGVLLAPITLAFGAPVSFALIMTLNLAVTGIGWYLLFSRTLGLRRAAAAVGGGFTAFAPGMVSQANAHVHMTAQWLVPAIVWCVLRLAKQNRLPRIAVLGATLGALVVLHVFLAEEVLFLTALTLAIFVLLYGVLSPRSARPAVLPLTAGLAVAGVVALAALSHVLRLQFSGPQSVPNGPFNPAFFSADLAGFTTISPLSWAGDPAGQLLVSSPSEYNGFFGWPLILVVGGATVWLWRRPAVVAAAVTAIVMCALSLGPQVVVNRDRTDHSGPYALLAHLPMLDNALPTRFALGAIPPIALILASAVHAALADRQRVLRLLVPAAVTGALIPLLAAPLPTQHRPPVPEFFTGGYWRGCVPRNGVLVPVPLPDGVNPSTMRWAAAADDQFAIPQGWFIGPYAAGGRASVGIYSRPTAALLDHVAQTGETPPITAKEQADAAKDVGYWGASCVVLGDEQANAGALKATLDALFGPGRRVVDVWQWKV